jgi:diguanylate cyclase (GGDEF)-like protein
MRLPTESILVVVVGLTGGAVLALGGLLATEARRTSEDLGAVNAAHETRVELAGLTAALNDAETGSRGYLLTGDRAYLDPYHDAGDRAKRSLDRLRELTAGDSPLQARLRELERLVRDKLVAVDETVRLHDDRGRDAALSLVQTGRGRELMEEVRGLIGQMRAEEEARLAGRLAVSADRAGRVRTVAGVLIGGAVAQIIAGLVLIRRDLAVRRRAEDQLRDLAARDPLTRLCNRRELERRLQVASDRHRASGLPLAAVLVDVDHFKAVNDTHGHAVGDAVLQAVAARLTGAVRAGDVVARYGGEEFALLLPGVGPGEAAAVAERARRAIAADPYAGAAADGRPLSFPITASFGVACLDVDGEPDLLLRRCDRALYQAKRAGRDRVVVFDPTVDTAVIRLTPRLPTPTPRSPA